MPREGSDGETGPHGYGIAAVERTLAVVAALVRLGPSSLTSLSAAAGCTSANVFRILRTLEARGLATQDSNRGAWRLGAGWSMVARAAGQHGATTRAAAPAMAALAASCGEQVSLAVRDGEQCEVLAAHQANPAGRQFVQSGERWPLHAGPGRLLLAYAPPAIQRAVLASRLPRLAAGTLTDSGRVRAELPRIRARNWLIATEEIAEAAVTVSTTVQDPAGAVIAALSIAAPLIRMRPPRPHTVLTPLLVAAEAIGQALTPLA